MNMSWPVFVVSYHKTREDYLHEPGSHSVPVDYLPARILIMHALWIPVKVSLVWVPLGSNLQIGVATL